MPFVRYTGPLGLQDGLFHNQASKRSLNFGKDDPVGLDPAHVYRGQIGEAEALLDAADAVGTLRRLPTWTRSSEAARGPPVSDSVWSWLRHSR